MNEIATLLGAVNDLSSAQPYGDGWLVTTPFTYSDGDSVTVLVEPMNSGFRVTDRGEALDRLSMWGVTQASGRAREAIMHARHAGRLSQVGSSDEEMATFGDQAAVGAMILDVAQASLRAEQLRWLALERPAMKFDDRLSYRLESLASQHRWTFKRRAEIALPGKRTRQVTAAVTGRAGSAYVQAVSDSDRERAVANCYYLFDRAMVPRESKVAALAGYPDSWKQGLRDDLQSVAVVAFFDEAGGLERELERITGGPVAASL